MKLRKSDICWKLLCMPCQQFGATLGIDGMRLLWSLPSHGNSTWTAGTFLEKASLPSTKEIQKKKCNRTTKKPSARDTMSKFIWIYVHLTSVWNVVRAIVQKHVAGHVDIRNLDNLCNTIGDRVSAKLSVKKKSTWAEKQVHAKTQVPLTHTITFCSWDTSNGKLKCFQHSSCWFCYFWIGQCIRSCLHGLKLPKNLPASPSPW